MQLIVTALDSEARPLLDHYRLRADSRHSAFRVYRSDAMVLIVSGMGRVNAAAATAYLAALSGPGEHVWLNIGIGGQRDYPVGSPWLAHQISLSDADRHWYPPLIFPPPCGTAHLCTVDRPEFAYPDNCIYEMEAAGFYPTAIRFSSAELAHSLKIISDNAEHSAERLRPADVSGLIAASLDSIQASLEELTRLADELTVAAQITALPELPWRVSVSQQHQLRELLRRYRVRFAEEPDFVQFKDAKNCLAWLREHLRQIPQCLA